VQNIEVGNEKGALYYTFPLYALALDILKPPGEQIVPG